MSCNNCRMKMGCGCNKRTASDGKSCCASCINAYEAQIKTLKNNSSTSKSILPINVISAGKINK